jgi:hypothetical protein
METKKCSVCEIEKDLDEYYKQNKESKKRGKYVYYNPECKKCTSKRSQEWGNNNKDRRYINNHKFDKSKKGVEIRRERNKRYIEKGKRKEWIENNKQRLYHYNLNHCNHNITQEEWRQCKKYFGNSCAYCGMSEDEHKNAHKQQLHREHVNHQGDNDLSNCVPACRSCNSLKSTYDFKFWYKEKSGIYNEDSYRKIAIWLESDYKLFYEREVVK